MSSSLMMLTLALFFILQALSYSHASDWSLSGLCKDTLLDFSLTRNMDECMQLGRSTSDATWVSFKPTLGVCVALAGCERLDSSSTGILSTRVDRAHCRVAGACRGPIITSVRTADSKACLDECTALPDCAWFSFEQESGKCQALELCEDLETGGTSWLTGESTCPGNIVKK